MEDLITHFKEYATGYTIGAVCLAPLIYVTRKYSIPLILYLIEFTIYACSIHVVTWCLVGLTRWFKENSSMRALAPDGRPLDAPDWGTPLLEFWDKEAYNPSWIWIAEVVCMIIALALMWRYRPMRIQRKPQRATQEFGKSTARSGPSGRPPQRGASGRPTPPRSRRGRQGR